MESCHAVKYSVGQSLKHVNIHSITERIVISIVSLTATPSISSDWMLGQSFSPGQPIRRLVQESSHPANQAISRSTEVPLSLAIHVIQDTSNANYSLKALHGISLSLFHSIYLSMSPYVYILVYLFTSMQLPTCIQLRIWIYFVTCLVISGVGKTGHILVCQSYAFNLPVVANKASLAQHYSTTITHFHFLFLPYKIPK